MVGNNVSKEKKDLVKATHDSLFKAIGMCKPGTFYRDIGGVITKHINGNGFAVDRTYCGHGIGEWFHCAPNIPHYAGNKVRRRIYGVVAALPKRRCRCRCPSRVLTASPCGVRAWLQAKFTMKPGHIFTIEPMVNMGSWKDTHWLDGWTAVTKDGLPSAQFEHTLLITESGVDILTARLPTSPPLWWEVEAAAAGAPGEPVPLQ